MRGGATGRSGAAATRPTSGGSGGGPPGRGGPHTTSAASPATNASARHVSPPDPVRERAPFHLLAKPMESADFAAIVGRRSWPEKPNYDLMVLLDPEAPEERRAQLIEQIRGQIQSGDATLKGDADWGMRRLAYEIDHRTEAQYHLFQFEASADVLSSLDRSLSIEDAVLRFRTIRLPGEAPEQTPQAPPQTSFESGRREGREGAAATTGARPGQPLRGRASARRRRSAGRGTGGGSAAGAGTGRGTRRGSRRPRQPQRAEARAAAAAPEAAPARSPPPKRPPAEQPATETA